MNKAPVVIVDYGLGNLFNVQRAFEAAGAHVVISSKQQDIEHASRLVLPGVGAFQEGMLGLIERGLVDSIKDFALTGRPLMGICLGMQLLMSHSEEFGFHEGLSLVKGSVVRLQGACKVPQIGWNELVLPGHLDSWQETVLRDLEPRPHMYFLHSFMAKLETQNNEIAYASYGENSVCSVFQEQNIVGIQPHVERSGETVGIRVLKNFLRL